jgi:hypothetical protein
LFHNITKETKSNMLTASITSRIIETKLINWNELRFIQQENFKEWVNNGTKTIRINFKISIY